MENTPTYGANGILGNAAIAVSLKYLTKYFKIFSLMTWKKYFTWNAIN